MKKKLVMSDEVRNLIKVNVPDAIAGENRMLLFLDGLIAQINEANGFGDKVSTATTTEEVPTTTELPA